MIITPTIAAINKVARRLFDFLKKITESKNRPCEILTKKMSVQIMKFFQKELVNKNQVDNKRINKRGKSLVQII